MGVATKGSISYKEYNEKYRLPEQERDERLLLERKHYVLAYEPGKGKSYPVIHCILEVQKSKKRPIKVLIMSDATCIRDMWKAEIVPQEILPKDTHFVTDRTAIGKMQDFLLTEDWDIIVCDECQSLRSGVTRKKSKYAKLVYTLCKKVEYAWGMTGTLVGNNNIEPFCVLHALHVAGLGEIHCRAFKRNYCIKELQYGPFGSFEKPTELNVFGRQLMEKAYEEGCSFWNYDESDNMPPFEKRVVTFKVPATNSYKEALQGILKCGETESTVIKAIALQKAQQALNGFLYYDFEGVRKTFNVPNFINPKLNYVVEKCKKEIHIVAYRFQEDGQYIRDSLVNADIKYCNEIDEFKEKVAHGEHIILVIQCARGKAANIQVCNKLIYYTADFSFINFKQMIHRIWRRGQTTPCEVTFLVNDPGDNYKVEYNIWRALRTKESIHETIMNIKKGVS